LFWLSAASYIGVVAGHGGGVVSLLIAVLSQLSGFMCVGFRTSKLKEAGVYNLAHRVMLLAPVIAYAILFVVVKIGSMLNR